MLYCKSCNSKAVLVRSKDVRASRAQESREKEVMLKKAYDVLQKKKKAQGMIQMANESLPGVFPKLKPSPRTLISVETEPKEEEEEEKKEEDDKEKTGSQETLK